MTTIFNGRTHVLSIFAWTDVRTAQEREMGGNPRWRAVRTMLDVAAIAALFEDESSDTKGAVLVLRDGTEIRTAEDYDEVAEALHHRLGGRHSSAAP